MSSAKILRTYLDIITEANARAIAEHEQTSEGMWDSAKKMMGIKKTIKQRYEIMCKYTMNLGSAVYSNFIVLWQESSEQDKETLLDDLETCITKKRDDAIPKILVARLNKSKESRDRATKNRNTVTAHDDQKAGAAYAAKQRDAAHDASKKYNVAQAAKKAKTSSFNPFNH